MGYSVTFFDYVPAARGTADGPWTRVRFEEAGDARRGPWFSLDTQTLSPVDSDPTLPQVRTLTTDQATRYPGWFRLVWIDAFGGEQPTEPEYAGSAVRPSVQEVANLMPDRTTIDGSSEAGTFTAGTQPTAEQVDSLIDMVLDTVDSRVPDDASAEAERAARGVVTLTTAMLIETGRFGDQRDVNDARVGFWERLLASHEAMLDQATQHDEPGQPRFGSLPVTSPTLTAWAALGGISTTELIP
jgi:hypothetical protein